MTDITPSASIINDEATREAMRQVIAERGQAVDARDRERYPDDPSSWMSYYGWRDYDADRHRRDHSCAFVVPAGVNVIEVNYSQFEGTDDDSSEHHGLLAYGDEGSAIHCECGKHTDIVLMYKDTLSSLIQATLKKLNPDIKTEDDLRGGFQL